ncbi:MAG TPA: tetratricopeptide repeat protein [Polyangiaceae bacterium]|nr:tetratricopeptide repeat protein [Polyangiaceae bacterium]
MAASDEEAPHSAPWTAYHERGDAALGAGRWEEAVRAYTLAIRENPGAVASYVNRGHGLCHLGRWEDAVRSYREARDLDPAVRGASENLGDALLRLERWDEAIAAYAAAIVEAPESASCHVNLGHALFHSNRHAEAVESYRRGFLLRPEDPSPLHGIADGLLRMSRWDEAASAYETALARQPGVVASQVNLGNALCQLGRFRPAVQAYLRALALDPAFPGLNDALGNAFSKLGAWQDAANAYAREIALRPGAPWPHVNLGHALFRLQRWAEAKEAYARALEVATDGEARAAATRALTNAIEAEEMSGFGNLRRVAVDLEVTSVCDADCGFCPRAEMPKKKRLVSMEVVERLAAEVKKHRIYLVVLCGIGESTLHPELDRIVETLAAAGTRVEMTTHGGARLDVPRFERLVSLGLAGLNFSLNANSPETHRRVMRLTDYEETVKNVAAILEEKHRRHPDVTVHVSCVVCDQNQHEVEDFVRFWRERRPSKIWLHPLNNRAGLLAPGVRRVDLERYRRLYEGDDLVLVDVFSEIQEDEKLCKIAEKMVFISADGDVRLCAMDYKRVTSSGSMTTGDLSEMHKDKLEKFLRGENTAFCAGCDFCPPSIRRPELRVLQ